MPEYKLRERGIYTLPDGTEFIVCAVREGGWNLYEPPTWNTFGIADYRAHPDGQVFWKGDPTPWMIDDLLDTGRTAELLLSPLEGRDG